MVALDCRARPAGSCSAQACTEAPGRTQLRIHAFPLSARGLSSKALPGGIVCELATDRRPRGAAPPQETRHASDRANSRPPLAPSQQPPPATSSPPPLWPRPPRRAPKSPAPRRRPLGPQRWRRGWDRTDVAHAWWRH